MRKIITTTFVTLDGVMQAPGGPEEDTSGGFKYGGWQFAWEEKDEKAERIMNNLMATQYDLLLGRLTYNIWVGFWPKHKDVPLFGKSFDVATKYVVSHKAIKLPWKTSVLITDDVTEHPKGVSHSVVAAIKKLKDTEGPDLCVWGSGNLIQTLLKHNLIDRMHIWTYPLTIGKGKKLFADGTQPERFTVIDTQITSTGVVYGIYEPANPLKRR